MFSFIEAQEKLTPSQADLSQKVMREHNRQHQNVQKLEISVTCNYSCHLLRHQVSNYHLLT